MPDPADRALGDEAFDVDGAGAFQRDSLDFLVLQQDMVVLAPWIALGLVLLGHRLAGFRVDILLDQTIARRAVERMEPQPAALGRCRNHRVTSNSLR